MSSLPRGFFGDGDATELAPGTFFLPSFANATAFLTSEGVLLVDCGHEAFGGRILEGLRRHTDAPVHTIVFTHGHVDHAFGVRAFDSERTQALSTASRAARSRPARGLSRGDVLESVAKLSGIGCSSKTPTYFLSGAHGFNSAHGRMAAIATGANAANKQLHYIGGGPS